MRKALLTFAIVFTIAMASTAFAQTPYFQLYFDECMQEASADCPGSRIRARTPARMAPSSSGPGSSNPGASRESHSWNP